MCAISTELWTTNEGFLADLTDAAYRVVLRHGLQGPFLDVELELWRELRAVIAKERLAMDPAVPAAFAADPPPEPARSASWEPAHRAEVVA
jgi:hypothetical protein